MSKKESKTMRWAKSESRFLKSAPTRASVESVIRTDPKCAISPEQFNQNLSVIGTPAGTVNLETGIMSLAKPKEYITKLTGCSPNKDTPPTLWIKFLNEIFDSDQKLICFIQILCGYILTGLTSEQKLFFLYGTGANGKSIFLETLFYILGDYAKRAPASMFLEQRNESHPTAMAGLEGSRFVVGSEVPGGATFNVQMVKDSTGGDTITARKMRQDFRDFKPQFTILIAGNHQPRLRSVDESVRRRMVMIPFTVTIPKENRDVNLGKKLKDEAGSILQWCIEGAVQYFKHGLTIPERVSAASSEYIRNEDVIGEFIDVKLITGERCEFPNVYKCYQKWLKAQGYNYTMTERQFRKELKDRGMNIKRSNSNYILIGYSLGWDY